MKRRVQLLACIFAMSGLGSVALLATKTSAAEGELRSADQAWMKVFSAKNLDQAMAFMAPNGSVLAPNAPTATGTDAVRKVYAGLLALPDLRISWTPTTAAAARSGDLGYTQGTYDMSFTDAGGKQVSDKGKYVTIWKKQPDKSWKVLVDIFNSDLPPAGAQAQHQ
jgi:ketosteroid isomerase-like protein